MGTISNATAVYALHATGTPTKTQVANNVLVGSLNTTVPLLGATKSYVVSATLATAGDILTVDTETGIATAGTTPVAQVETATVVAGSGATSNGTLVVTVTGARITGSPLAISVPLTTATHTTATLIAGAIRTAMNATASLTAVYTVGGAGADVTLTEEADPQNNDATLNVAWPTTLGVSAVASSTNTTAGVGGVKLTNNTGDGRDFEGVEMVTGTGAIVVYYGFVIRSLTGVMATAYDTSVFSHAVTTGSVICAFHPTPIDASSTGLIVTALENGCEVEITFICGE